MIFRDVWLLNMVKNGNITNKVENVVKDPFRYSMLTYLLFLIVGLIM